MMSSYILHLTVDKWHEYFHIELQLSWPTYMIKILNRIELKGVLLQ